MEMQYRCLTAEGLDNLPQAAEIRQEVFVEEQGFHNEFDEIDPKAVHLLVLEGDTPVAVGRTFPDETGKVWHLGRICVRKPWRGRQLGRLVMEQLEKAARERKSWFFQHRCRQRAFMKSWAIPLTERNIWTSSVPM